MTDDEQDICGEPTGEDGNGSPCKRPAGWGRDEPRGPCVDHVTDQPRPRKLTTRRQENIAQALEAGVSFKAACEASGISKEAGHRWLRLGEEYDEGLVSDFRNRITRARGQGKFELANSIVEIAKETNDAGTLLRYLQHVEGGEAGQDDEDLAGLNLVVPDIAARPEQNE
jgi:transposase-like protein